MKTKEELLESIYSHFPNSEDKDETMCMLIVDCIETGITYWNTMWPTVNGEKETYSENVWEELKSGKQLEFGDEEEIGEISIEKINFALNRLKKSNKEVYKHIQNKDWDAIDCDEFFQTAAFGEVVFG